MLSFDDVPSDHEAFRASEPDPLGLMDVIELIAPGAQVTGWEPMVGGMDAAMHRIDVAMPRGATTAFVLRRHYPEWTTTEEVVREAETLEKLRPTPVPAPELLWLDAGGNAFGVPAVAITLLPGRAGLATDDPIGWARELAEPLAGIHLVPASVVDHLSIDEEPEALWARLTAIKEPREADELETGAILDALERGLDLVVPGELRLLHGDYHGGQVLRDEDDRVTGVVDWVMARIGDPRWDVAYAHYDTTLVHGPAAAGAFLERYVELTGRAVEPAWWWQLLAVVTSLPDPAIWGAAMVESGADVTPDLLRERARAYVARCLDEAGG